MAWSWLACRVVAYFGLVALLLGAPNALDLRLAHTRVVDAAHLDRRLVRQAMLVHAHDRLCARVHALAFSVKRRRTILLDSTALHSHATGSLRLRLLL